MKRNILQSFINNDLYAYCLPAFLCPWKIIDSVDLPSRKLVEQMRSGRETEDQIDENNKIEAGYRINFGIQVHQVFAS